MLDGATFTHPRWIDSPYFAWLSLDEFLQQHQQVPRARYRFPAEPGKTTYQVLREPEPQHRQESSNFVVRISNTTRRQRQGSSQLDRTTRSFTWQTFPAGQGNSSILPYHVSREPAIVAAPTTRDRRTQGQAYRGLVPVRAADWEAKTVRMRYRRRRRTAAIYRAGPFRDSASVRVRHSSSPSRSARTYLSFDWFSASVPELETAPGGSVAAGDATADAGLSIFALSLSLSLSFSFGFGRREGGWGVQE